MILCVTSEFHFQALPDGTVWTPTSFPYAFWQRYLDGFAAVEVVARVARAREAVPGWRRVDGAGVTVHALPDYRGAARYLAGLPALRSRIHAALADAPAAVLRVPSPIADLAAVALRRRGQPYGLEIVGDPWDVLAPGAVRHPLRPALRRLFARRLRRLCREAAATAYVTRETLQRRYPPRAGAFTTHYSSIRLQERDFARRPGAPAGGWPADGAGTAGAGAAGAAPPPLRVVAVGTMAQMYKGFDTLIEAAGLCGRQGMPLALTLVGDGACRGRLEELARRHAGGPPARFTGQLPAGEAVHRELDAADLFVLPSRQEGLPRAMIEAMARSLPCIGTAVGGTPELLPPDCLVPPDDPAALARAIADLARRPERQAELGRRNHEAARAYLAPLLDERRRAFYAAVRAATEQWRRGRGAPGGAP